MTDTNTTVEPERVEIKLDCDKIDCQRPSVCSPVREYPSHAVVFCVPEGQYDSLAYVCACVEDDCGECSFLNWIDCNTEECCNQAGRWWYSDTCNQCAVECESGDITYCISSDCCEKEGWYWYDEICNECSSPCMGGDFSSCNTFDCCLLASGVWTTNGCADCGSCSESSHTGCVSKGCCEFYGWYWYDEQCNEVSSDGWANKTNHMFWEALMYFDESDTVPERDLVYYADKHWEAFASYKKWVFTDINTWASGYRPAKVRFATYGNITQIIIRDTNGATIGSDIFGDQWDIDCEGDIPYQAEINLSYVAGDIHSIEVYAYLGSGWYDSIYGAICKIEFWEGV